jgi:hypothetical protein
MVGMASNMNLSLYLTTGFRNSKLLLVPYHPVRKKKHYQSVTTVSEHNSKQKRKRYDGKQSWKQNVTLVTDCSKSTSFYQTPYCTNNISFMHDGALRWNSIPKEVRESTSPTWFKCKIATRIVEVESFFCEYFNYTFLLLQTTL